MAAKNVIIVGGGIGGLTLAGALTRRGVGVTVLERAPELRARGLGFTIWPNATAALHAAGLLDSVRTAAGTIVQATLRTNSGRKLVTIDVKAWGERLGAPALTATRPDLLAALAGAAGAAVRFDAEVVWVSPDRGEVELADGELLRADAVIGADGVGSAVRRSLFAARQNTLNEPMLVGWQGLVPQGRPRIEVDMIFGPTGAAGILGLPGDRTYWFLQAPKGRVPENGSPFTTGWSPRIQELIAATPADALWRDDVRDREPTPNWGRGKVTLLGDAAHPIVPNLGQGACLAMEDAAILAQWLVNTGDPVTALRSYEQARFTRVRDMYRNARRAARMQRLAPALRDPMLSAAPSVLRRVFTAPGNPLPELAPL